MCGVRLLRSRRVCLSRSFLRFFPQPPMPLSAVREKGSSHGGFNVTLSYERTGLRTLLPFPSRLIVRVLPFTMIFFFNCLSLLSPPFFSLPSSLKRKRNTVAFGVPPFPFFSESFALIHLRSSSFPPSRLSSFSPLSLL